MTRAVTTSEIDRKVNEARLVMMIAIAATDGAEEAMNWWKNEPPEWAEETRKRLS